MIQIKLTHDKVALVDGGWYEYLNQFHWYAKQSTTGKWYAIRNDRGRQVHMHREILDAPQGMDVDHINGNGLDNRRRNLRLATHAENLQNRDKPSNNTTGYKGVSRQRGRKKFRAIIWTYGKKVELGWYADPKDAARAYDKAARQLHGKFARTNF